MSVSINYSTAGGGGGGSFTEAEVLATDLAGLSTASSAAITSSSTVLEAMGKLQAQITAGGYDFGNITGSATFPAGAAVSIGSFQIPAGALNSINRRLRVHAAAYHSGGTATAKQVRLRVGSTSGTVIWSEQCNAAASSFMRTIGETIVTTTGATGVLKYSGTSVINSSAGMTTITGTVDLTAALTIHVCLESGGAITAESIICDQCHVYLE